MGKSSGERMAGEDQAKPVVLETPLNTKQSMVSDMVVRLIGILRDGIEIYQAAHERTDDAFHRQLFRQMIDLREAAIARLRPYALSSHADIPEGASATATAGRTWTELKTLFGDTESVFLKSLRDMEERTLAAIDDTISGLPDSEARHVVEDLRAEFGTACNDIEDARRSRHDLR